MGNANPYEANETMKLLGHQHIAEIITKEVRKQMGEITAARKYTTTFTAAADMFVLGYIHGKRTERAKRKAVWNDG